MAFAAAAAPRSVLGYHRMLAPTAAVRVSPLCLGGMNFGEAWKDLMGDCSQDTAFEILDYFHSKGGNFIDTANNYQRGESEQWIGAWMKKRGLREQIVLATKYTTAFRGGAHGSEPGEIIVNTGGNGAKSLKASLERSLKNFQTDYVDLLYIHWWDFTTSIEELMQSLDVFVKAGKVLYLGASDTPAWIIAKANQYARDHGLRQFSVVQGKWDASVRDLEREIVPMALADGMGIAAWGTLGEGKFKTEEQRAKQIAQGQGRGLDPQPENVKAIVRALDTIAKKKGTLVTSVAMAYVLHKSPYVFPIVGGRNLEHLKGNIEALSLRLTEEEIEDIEKVGDFDLGFPGNFLGTWAGDARLNGIGGMVDYVLPPKPLVPRQL